MTSNDINSFAITVFSMSSPSSHWGTLVSLDQTFVEVQEVEMVPMEKMATFLLVTHIDQGCVRIHSLVPNLSITRCSPTTVIGDVVRWRLCSLMTLLVGDVACWRHCSLETLLVGWHCSLVMLLIKDFACWCHSSLVTLLFWDVAH